MAIQPDLGLAEGWQVGTNQCEEATRLAAEVDLREAATVCVLGFGLGRHVEEIARRMGRTGLVIVLEPDVDLLKSVLARVDCSDWLAESNVLFVDKS